MSVAGSTPANGNGSGPHFLQVRFSAFIPVAQLNPNCPLGAVTCDFGARVVKLAD
jgi:hypothetical protein